MRTHTALVLILKSSTIYNLCKQLLLTYFWSIPWFVCSTFNERFDPGWYLEHLVVRARNCEWTFPCRREYRVYFHIWCIHHALPHHACLSILRKSPINLHAQSCLIMCIPHCPCTVMIIRISCCACTVMLTCISHCPCTVLEEYLRHSDSPKCMKHPHGMAGWLAKDKEDGKTKRTLYSRLPDSLVSYKITVYTGDRPDGGTVGRVSIRLQGVQGTTDGFVSLKNPSIHDTVGCMSRA